MIDIIFVLLAALAIAGGIIMLLCSSPIYSALGLILAILALAGVYALLSAPFIFMVQIIVYAGAIIALILFIIMFLNIKKENLPKEPHKNMTIIVSAILLLPLNFLVIKSFATLPSKSMDVVGHGFGSVKAFGDELFRNWLVPFELISLLLLAALIGAVVYARKDKTNV